MNGLGFAGIEREIAHRESATTPYMSKLQAREEQAFYERYGALSTRLPMYKRAATSVAVVAAVVGAVFAVMHGVSGA